MTCTLIKDGIRTCQSRFSLLVQDVSTDFCISSEYNICPFYRIIVENKQYCEKIEECGYHLHRLNSHIRHDTGTYKKIMNLVFDYCLSANKDNCARLKYFEEEKQVPNALLQDGSYLKSLDFMKDNYY